VNVTEANRYLPALNRIAEGVTMLASAIEEAAWESFEDHPGMSGTRPIAAAQLAQPALEAAAEEHDAAHQPPAPAPAPTPAVAPVSLGQVRTVLARLSQSGHTAQVRELIQAAGANKLSEVDPDKFGQLLEQAEAITDA
jgi:rRNA biogenesis protein rrp5